ncbi:hypothetical protein RHS01_10561 [Rhizoctonia solani]|uniref:RNase H type-1 domain-containing protein n=1 Tax=Rhizoctonia solani TaxID=456999 RepID=A0A8H7I1Y2_9AGAM|nr:hypothetical protein RHS01_10561 [Rhizoctonia solani]
MTHRSGGRKGQQAHCSAPLSARRGRCARPLCGATDTWLVQRLEKTQNVGLRWILGAFRTSPISALGHLASIPRFTSHLQESRKTPPPVSPLFLLSRNQPKIPSQGSHLPIIALANLSHPKCERIDPYIAAPWDSPISGDQGSRPISHPSRLVKTERNMLTASLAWRPALRKTARLSASPMGRNETPPAGRGCHLLYRKSKSTWRSPHRALRRQQSRTLKHLTTIKTPCQYASRDFRSAVDNFLSESPLNKVKLHWVPGHEGVEGNDRADALANEGGTKPPMHSHNRSITWSKAEATRNASLTWSHLWSSNLTFALSQNTSVATHPCPSTLFKAFPCHRAIHARLIQVIMGHAFLGEYRERFRLTMTPAAHAEPLVRLSTTSFELAHHSISQDTPYGKCRAPC